MLVAGGLHPYALKRRQNALSGTKSIMNGAAPALVLAMAVIVGFACGLRLLDRRYAPTSPTSPVESRSSDTKPHHLTA